MAALPTSSRVVVCGGGIIGTSIAYHLAKLGCDSVTLLERDQITSGTTWHAAGLICSFGSLSETSCRLRQYSKQFYMDVAKETGQETGFRACGYIEIASDKDRLEEYRRVSAFNRRMGVNVNEISPSQVKDLFPLAKTDDIHAGFYIPEDGRINPVDVTMAIAKGAKLRGVKIFEQTPVDTIIRTGNRATGVITQSGHKIECEHVINCCGMWARQFAAKAGVKVALQAAEHYYLLTDTIPGVDPAVLKSYPVIEDPGHYGYYREEGGGLLVGLFEPVCAPWNVRGIPATASFTTIEPDWERMTPFLERAMERVPITKTTGIRKLFCGPESFTPDLSPIVGPAPELKNYFVCAGLNSIGILSGGGLGRAVASWVLNGKPDMDVTGMNIDRIQPYQVNPNFLAERTVEVLGSVYSCHYPYKARKTARNVRRSPIHERIQAAGAEFIEVSGWESPSFYWSPDAIKANGGKKPTADLGWNLRELSWFKNWEREHHAARNGVCLVDMSFMCKFSVQGADAGKTLNWISANNVDNEPNKITYTQWCSEDGLLEADVTVVKLAEDDFFVVATDTALGHVKHHFSKHAPAHVALRDVTSAYAQINIQGPKSRALMQAVSPDTDFSHTGFPFRRAQKIAVGFADVMCVRITYMGELGYELYVPADQAVHVYDILHKTGAQPEFGLVHAGLRALGSCRQEKAYRDYGHDLDNTDQILDSGLQFAISWKKPGGFLGKAACEKYKSDPAFNKAKLVQVLCKDKDQYLFHSEPILRDGKFVGYVRSASYGHTLGGAVGIGRVEVTEGCGFDKVTDDYLKTGKWELEIGNGRFPCVVSQAPLYDPGNKKIQC